MSGALPVMLLTPSMQTRRVGSRSARSSSSRWSGSSKRKRLHGRAARAGDLAAVVDRLVRPRVEEDRARGGQQRDHRHVDVRDRRQHERVLAAEQLGQPLLDLLVEHRAAEQPRPARVGAPRVEVRGDRVDDLAVEVEAEVVARREVGQPVVADADHAAVDLVDDRVHHRVRGLQRREVAAGVEPVLHPRATAAGARAAGRAGTGDGRRRPSPLSSDPRRAACRPDGYQTLRLER